jgi:hypothetical protein
VPVVGDLQDPEAGEVLLRLQERAVGVRRPGTAVVDHGGRAGSGEAAGEEPEPLGLEPVVEGVDGGVLDRGGGAGAVVEHGNQILHGGHLLWMVAPDGAVHPCYERTGPDPTSAPEFLSGDVGRGG